MKPINRFLSISVIATSLVSMQTLAIGNLKNAKLSSVNVNDSIQNTLSEHRRSDGSWITYRVDMEVNNGMPCCFQGDNDVGCRLDKRVNSWGSHRDDEGDSKVLNVYLKWEGKRATELFYAGSECPVDAGGHSVLDISGVSQEQSINFLSQYLAPYGKGKNKRLSSKALAGIALHQGSFAQRQLEALSKKDSERLSKQAIFWIGEARNKAGYDYLVELLDDNKRSSAVKEKAVFALTQNDYSEAMEKLIELAQDNSDARIQAKAVFWLGQSEHPQAARVIESIFDSNASHRVKEKAVFALSELNTEDSWQRLTQIAKSDEFPSIREKAIFWVSQNDERDAKQVLMDVIDGRNPESIKVKAVFGLSQLDNGLATESLIQVMQTADNKRVRKQALFWLGQSSDPKALEAIEKIVTASVD